MWMTTITDAAVSRVIVKPITFATIVSRDTRMKVNIDVPQTKIRSSVYAVEETTVKNSSKLTLKVSSLNENVCTVDGTSTGKPVSTTTSNTLSLVKSTHKTAFALTSDAANYVKN